MYNYNKDFVDVSKRLDFSETEMMALYSIIEEILNHEKWEEMTQYMHHMDTRAVHAIEVCCVSWRKAIKNKKCDSKAVAIGALLHDFFFYDWQMEKPNIDSHDIKLKVYSFKLHGFVHPLIAYDNAKKYFPHLMNKKIKGIIEKHMWPLTLNPPRCKEAWIVCMVDKSCSLNVFKYPKELPRYLGFKMKKVK